MKDDDIKPKTPPARSAAHVTPAKALPASPDEEEVALALAAATQDDLSNAVADKVKAALGTLSLQELQDALAAKVEAGRVKKG